VRRPDTDFDGEGIRQSPAASLADSAVWHDRAGTFPHEHFVLLEKAGLLGLTVPERLGGGAAGLRDAMGVVHSVSRTCPSTGLVLAMQCLHHHAIARSQRWPPHLAEQVGREAAVSDGALINSLRVEPELGTPARGGLPATTARHTSVGWSLSGHKIYCTGAPGLTWLIAWARTDEDPPRVGSFLMPARQQGIRIVESWDHLGLRASASHDVVLDDVRVPADHAVDIRPSADWIDRDPAQAIWNVTLISSVYTGVAESARNWLQEFLCTRIPANLGSCLASLPRMQEAMGRIEARLTTNKHLLRLLGEPVADGHSMPILEADLLKVVMADNAIDAVQEAIGLCSNHSLMRSNPLERHLRDVMCARIHTPQADSALVAAGRARLHATPSGMQDQPDGQKPHPAEGTDGVRSCIATS
jgi:alkylation response protein AidB-like acyl-CoA dehydrogenase